jgi:hypothetical protein
MLVLLYSNFFVSVHDIHVCKLWISFKSKNVSAEVERKLSISFKRE